VASLAAAATAAAALLWGREWWPTSGLSGLVWPPSRCGGWARGTVYVTELQMALH